MAFNAIMDGLNKSKIRSDENESSILDSLTLRPEQGRLLGSLLSHYEERITEEFLLEQGSSSGITDRRQREIEALSGTVGLPSGSEEMAMDLLTLPQTAELIEKASVGDKMYPHNNEFTLFAYGKGKGLGDGIDGANVASLRALMNPAKARLRALFPSIVEELELYGENHKDQSKFYRGLIEKSPESTRLLLLFTIADNLMQRLTRPNDEVYELECFKRGSQAKGEHYEVPKYEEIVINGNRPITNAHIYLIA